MPETRKFAQGLKRKGTASKRRESATQAIRGSVYSAYEIKFGSSEAVDYEAHILKRQSEIQHDPLKELLTFPTDDVVECVKPRDLRTVTTTIPEGSLKEASSLLVQECIKGYSSDWHLIVKKYDDYAEDYSSLPKCTENLLHNLPEQIFELDEDVGVEEDISTVQKEGVTKRGWLHKAPAYGSASISIRAFKRRYFYLKQLPDGSYILNYYKDEKISKDPKGAIYLDSCIGAHMTTKARKYAFEIRMQDQTCHMLAADSEMEANHWISTINHALQSTIEAQVSQKDKHDHDMKSDGGEGDLGSLKSSMHPELIKYAKETDQMNTLARKESRLNVMKVFPDFQDTFFKLSEVKHPKPSIPPPQILNTSKHRVMVNCKTISFNLRGVVIDGAEEPVTNVEPFFVTLSLYDIGKGKKISADLHVDLNHPLVRRMIPTRSPSHAKRQSNSVDECKFSEPPQSHVDMQWIAHPKRGIFQVTNPSSDIYLVVRIEKVLQGSIKSCAAPYMKSESESYKAAAKVLKHAKVACQRLGQYRMPFAWTAKPLFTNDKGHINVSGFDMVYKQEASKLAEEDLLKFLSDFKRPEKLSKLEYIDCEIQVGVDSVPTDLANILTSSLVPANPFNPTVSEPVFEIDEFIPTSPSHQHLNMEYTNHFYIYPKVLHYDNQKTFAKARNIAVTAEFKDSDSENSPALCSFYKRPGPPGTGAFCSKVSAAVLHHNERPEFYDEWKLSLPTQLHSGHHILFSFYHVVVDINAKKKDATHMEIGHAWLPLLTKDGRVMSGVHNLPVSGSLPSGYLSAQDQLNAGRHNPEVKWVDGGKPLFQVNISLVSSIYSEDPHMHRFFEASQRFLTSSTSDSDIVKYLKSLLAVDHAVVVRFLPTLLKQLLYLFTADGFGSDAQSNCMKALVYIVAVCHDNGHDQLLRQYIKYMFVTAPWADYKSKTIHEELATGMTSMLRPSAADFLTTNKLLLHSSFFFRIITKSMAQHLINTNKLQQSRSERFPISFQHAIQSLLTTTVPHIIKKWKQNYSEVHSANISLATFIKDCFTYIDRGFVFKLINHYVGNFNPGDPKVLFEFKFEFLRIVCNHEHYIPLNLPFTRGSKHKHDYHYCLDDEYCLIHFLAGLLLKNLCSAMFEPPEIRSIAIETFRDLIAKHVFDDRYQTNNHQTRIATLYLPYLRILLDNVSRFSIDTDSTKEGSHSSRDDLTDIHTPTRFGGVGDSSPSIGIGSLPSIGERAGSLRARPDSSLMNAIANPGSSLLTRGSRGSLAVSEATNGPTSSPSTHTQRSTDKNHEKSEPSIQAPSIASITRFQGGDMLGVMEIRSLLVCFLHIINHLSYDALHGFWKDSTTDEQIDFFEALVMCLHHFRYTGKKHAFQGARFGSLNKLSSISKSRTLPVRIRPSAAHIYKHVSAFTDTCESSHVIDDAEMQRSTALEANLSTEVGKIVLDMVAEFTRQYKKQLQSRDGDNPLMQKLFDVLLTFLQIGQSEDVLRHVFASLRLVVCKFPNVLFRGSADLCASLIYQVLKCCNSSLASTRCEACALLYLLMRNNYQSGSGKNFVRSHLQMIKAVSQLISEEVGIGSSRFQHSLSVINTYAKSDKGVQSTSFPAEVKELTKKLRTVMMATAAMKEHKDNPEMLVDLQCSLAKSYSATPELRKTWLQSIARVHEKHGNFSEAAMCYVHIAALVAEYLKRKAARLAEMGALPEIYSDLSPAFVSKMFGEARSNHISPPGSGFGKGCSSFRSVSLNVEKEETSIKEDAGMQDVSYTEEMLVELLQECAEKLRKAERYEILSAIFNLAIPYYERKRDYDSLITIYTTLKEGYEKVAEVNRNGKRLLGTYFRVAFYGQQCFEDEDGKQYIYKEPKLTQLSEISQRLQRMYGRKFGEDSVKLIQESGKVNRKELDPKLAYIQITYVQPYFDEHEREQRRTYFERHHNIRNFVFETPFTPGGRARGDIEEQWKRKTILTSSHSFPYIKKRIPIITMRSFELKPIEVALDEMTSKCNELEQLITAERVDLKKLQLRLQGSVNVQVNAGPLAYARAFLRDDKVTEHAANTTEMLKQIYRRFVDLCGRALFINEQLITSNQQAYHESLHQCYITMSEELSQILHEQLLHDDEDTISVLTGFEPDAFAIGGNSTPKRSIAGSVSDSSVA